MYEDGVDSGFYKARTMMHDGQLNEIVAEYRKKRIRYFLTEG